MGHEHASDNLESAPVEAIVSNLPHVVAALGGTPELAGVLTDVAFAVAELRDHWPEVMRAMEGPGPAPG